jgi:rubrerythrin
METPIPEEAHDEWVVIKEEVQEWIQKLSHMLSEKDIPSRIALASIDEYYMELHPEIRESQELVDQGRCPACGHHVGTDARECPDCGLRLIIEEA